jgi:hypothetical protein
MINVKCKEDLEKIEVTSIRESISERVKVWMSDPVWKPSYGYLILVENGKDDIRKLPHLNEEDGGLLDDIWECCDCIGGVYYIVIVCNNDFAIEFAIVDDVSMDVDLRAAIMAHRLDSAEYYAEMKANQEVAANAGV